MKNQYLLRGISSQSGFTKRLQNSLLAVLCAFACLWPTSNLNAQVSAYGYNNSNTPYVEITGGSLLGSAANDDHRFVDPTVLAGTTSTASGLVSP